MNGNDALEYGLKPCILCGGTNIRKITRHNCIGHGEYTLYIGFECMTEDCFCVFGAEDYADREEEILDSAIRRWNVHKFRKLGENARIIE